MMRVYKTKLLEETRCMERLRLAVLLPVTETALSAVLAYKRRVHTCAHATRSKARQNKRRGGKTIPAPVLGIAVNYNVSVRMSFLVAFPHFSPFPISTLYFFPVSPFLMCNSSASPKDLLK